MSATVRIGGMEAAIDDDMNWTADKPILKKVLDAMMIGREVSGADPNPPLTAAMEAVERFGGEVLRYDETDYDEDKVY